ncbi:MAG: 4-carboxy-4-hydroxy-2-oxoadipate aldolase/oxaloacetate decarboxylase [Firmicutes bacterium]|nr:4-carboxy-4-hydroxy-2-oxoadipate aldolase/oxaloacetate decarboxylase [Bacillota bacterium]
MGYYVARRIPRDPRDQEWAARLSQFGVATVSEAQFKTGIMLPRIRPIQQGAAIAGRAVTAVCAPGDNLMVHVALEVIQPGDVLVVGSWAPMPNGVFGELLATGFKAHGVAGAVLDAGVRDTEAIRRLGFPVWADHISAVGNTKEIPGWVNRAVTVGGVLVQPGDFVVADDDGVVVVPRDSVEEVLARAQARVDKEAGTRQRFERGELSVDFYNLHPVLAQLGIEYREEAE